MSLREQDIIEDTLTEVYGKGIYVPVVAEQVSQAVNEALDDDRDLRDPRLEAHVTGLIWNCFPGGDTASLAAQRIIKALNEAGVV